MRRPIIAGNWKMNKTPSETVNLIDMLKPLVSGTKAEVVVCPTAVCLFAAKSALEGGDISLGAQNVFFEDHGAYTGEISVDSLVELGVKYVIIGHSERRQYFGETDAAVNKKVKKVLQKGLYPIICVGEKLEHKQKGITAEIVRMQTKLALEGLLSTDISNVVIAYEPIWAIGTGMTATNVEANNTIKEIRKAAREMLGAQADDMRIQYGGSMNADNVSEFMMMSDIDGGLIGGASLTAADFAKVVHY
ncbi:MAG: triose-phosphate isomerase [Christensenella sp.]